MQLGPILQVIVAVPALAPAADWAESALGLVLTGHGRFPRETALTLGSTALVDAPCVALGAATAPALLLLVEAPAAAAPAAGGWTGLDLRMPEAAGTRRGLGLDWSLASGAPALLAATLCTADPRSARGYYRGLGAAAPAQSPWQLPLREGCLRLQAQAVDRRTDGADAVAGRPLALLMTRGSVSATLPAPAAHGCGGDGEFLLLRDAPVLPEQA